MWPNQQEDADLATFTEEILNRKLYFFVQCHLSEETGWLFFNVGGCVQGARGGMTF